MLLLITLAGCSAAVRLEVPEGQMFRLTDAEEAPSAGFSVLDARVAPEAKSKREPLILVVGDEDLDPKPGVALRREIAARQSQSASAASAARRVNGKTIKLERFSLVIKAVDVSQPREGSGSTGTRPPAVELVGSVMQTLAQSLGGGSDVTASLTIDIEGQKTTGIGTWRTTSSPGNMSTVQAFRRAIDSLFAQLPDGTR